MSQSCMFFDLFIAFGLYSYLNHVVIREEKMNNDVDVIPQFNTNSGTENASGSLGKNSEFNVICDCSIFWYGKVLEAYSRSLQLYPEYQF